MMKRRTLLRTLIMVAATNICFSLKTDTLKYQDFLSGKLRGRIPGLALDLKSHADLEPLSITPYGFVQLEVHADSRQVVGSFEDLSTLYPKPIRLDPDGVDIDAHPTGHITGRRTNVGMLIGGPSWADAHCMAAIESDFVGIGIDTFGNAVDTVSLLRLRHAFLYANWEDWSLLIGQYWHPLEMPECWPEVVDGFGAFPVEFGARNPQIRFVKSFDQTYDIVLTFASERDFQSTGPIGPSTKYIRDAVTPIIDLQFKAFLENIFFAIAFNYKRLVPRIESFVDDTTSFAVEEHIDSFIGAAFFKWTQGQLQLRAKGGYVQNGSNLGDITGFGVKTQNERTGERTYANTNSWHVWSDLSYSVDPCGVHNLGLFGGYVKNLGSMDELLIDPTTKLPIIYTQPEIAQQLDYVLKLIPRYIFVLEPFVFGAELELTRASFGRPDEFARPQNPVPVNNARVTLQFNYTF